MIEQLVGLALRKRLVVALICVFGGLYGYYSWTQLAIEAYPDIADVTAQVVTQAPGLAAEEVEQQVTIPLERELNGTPGLFTMRSRSTFGLSLITLIFRDGIEDYWARQRVRERIANAELPTGLAPDLDPLSSPTGEIYKYTLESDTRGLRDLSEIQRWTVIPALKQVPGIADIENFGGLTTQFQLELDPQQLMRFNLSLKNVTDAITANSANSGGSVLARGQLGYVVRGVGVVQNLDDMGNIVVTQRNGTPILVRDLGKLKLSIAGTPWAARQERAQRRHRRNRAAAPQREPIARHGRRARQGRGAQRTAQGRGRAARALSRPLGPRRCDARQGLGHDLPGHRSRRHRAHSLSRQPAQRADRRHHHSACDVRGLHADEPHENSREPALARRHRLRDHRRRRHRDVGGDPAPPRGEGE